VLPTFLCVFDVTGSRERVSSYRRLLLFWISNKRGSYS